MDESAWRLVGLLAAPVVSAVIGALAASLKSAMDRERRSDERFEAEHSALVAGMRELLKAQLYDMHERYVVGSAPMAYEAKERAESIYRAYHSLGGNGTGTHIFNELMASYVGKEKE